MVIKSEEKTSHCGSEGKPLYGVAILPLINMPEVQSWTRNGTQVDGSFESLQNSLDNFNEHGFLFA